MKCDWCKKDPCTSWMFCQTRLIDQAMLNCYSWGKPSATGQFWNTCKDCQRGFPTQDPFQSHCGCEQPTDDTGVLFTPDRELDAPKECDCGGKVARTPHSPGCALNGGKPGDPF